jgi:2-dehydropantoate 2-reductase
LKFAIVGAGAIGAYVGASLARGGADVTLVARGAQLAALREHGVTVHSPRGDFSAHPAATGDLRSIGPVDVVILAVKAHQIEPLLPDLPALMHDDTAVVSMQNGIPWWYFFEHGGPYDGHIVQSVDPGGAISAAIETRRIVGCVIYCSTEIVAPGVIKHTEGTRYSLGDPARGVSQRTQRIADALIAGGLKAPVEADLRPEIWLKVLGNASFNPISALTRATLAEMTNDPLVEAAVTEMMRESVAIANALGVEIPITIEKRIDGARRVGDHKTSMLQDLEAHKPLELDALTGAVVEIGRLVGIPTPATSLVYALAQLLNKTTVETAKR